jgi:NitT/TauT family transport system substrate-binding protein
MSEFQLKDDDVKFVVLPPPDMPASLATGSIDGYFVGEPFCAKAELDGYGRVLYYARDIWPNFISCALVVHEDLISNNPEAVADLVRGIAESGQWAETHRTQAARIVAPYYRQDEKVLNFVLTSKPQRVSYTQLTPGDKEIQSILNIGHNLGYFKAQVNISGLIDRRFIPDQIKMVSIVSE